MLVVGAMALLWWGPTFMALSDLQRREGLRRGLFWKWSALLCIPVVGAVLYFRRGRSELDAVAPRTARRG
jgi:hypothetical protein